MGAQPTGTAGFPVAAATVVGGLVMAGVIIGAGPPLIADLPLAALGAAGGEAAFTLLIFGALLIAGVIGGSIGGMRVWRLGERPGKMAAIGVTLGAAGLMGATALAAVSGTVRMTGGPSGSPLLLAGAVVIAFQVAAEEVFFRGWLQPVLARTTSASVAIGAVAVAFAGLHGLARWPGALGMVNLTLGGVLFGILAARGGGIAGAFGAHVAWNGCEQLLFGLDPNPGVGSFGSLIDLDLVGASDWGGSADGLNASWAMAAALLAMVVPLVIAWSPPASSSRRGAHDHARVTPAPG